VGASTNATELVALAEMEPHLRQAKLCSLADLLDDLG
jgi:hypothetical protein